MDISKISKRYHLNTKHRSEPAGTGLVGSKFLSNESYSHEVDFFFWTPTLPDIFNQLLRDETKKPVSVVKRYFYNMTVNSLLREFQKSGPVYDA
ncbi:hypothetical protein [Dyadobacter psychrotolerans]|uniref:Uncharacterized protein n=1 Tax=Dyadobacter psychrotolerans TaxID=2541721 RepID=A0A4R5D7U0_9BACT|nr:hypothetical protein [Dyadobacter psychrotolerans]TDE09602.1 hypothetical protein E0F88_30410 [Dyadobacter psychrotolerans]